MESPHFSEAIPEDIPEDILMRIRELSDRQQQEVLQWYLAFCDAVANEEPDTDKEN